MKYKFDFFCFNRLVSSILKISWFGICKLFRRLQFNLLQTLFLIAFTFLLPKIVFALELEAVADEYESHIFSPFLEVDIESSISRVSSEFAKKNNPDIGAFSVRPRAVVGMSLDLAKEINFYFDLPIQGDQRSKVEVCTGKIFREAYVSFELGKESVFRIGCLQSKLIGDLKAVSLIRENTALLLTNEFLPMDIHKPALEFTAKKVIGFAIQVFEDTRVDDANNKSNWNRGDSFAWSVQLSKQIFEIDLVGQYSQYDNDKSKLVNFLVQYRNLNSEFSAAIMQNFSSNKVIDNISGESFSAHDRKILVQLSAGIMLSEKINLKSVIHIFENNQYENRNVQPAGANAEFNPQWGDFSDNGLVIESKIIHDEQGAISPYFGIDYIAARVANESGDDSVLENEIKTSAGISTRF